MTSTMSVASLDKQQEIADGVVAQILRGRLLPGDRLPTVAALQARHQVADKTVQRALGLLRGSGLIRSRRGSGSFVTSLPPCLGESALLFGREAGGPGWSPFYEALSRASLVHDDVHRWNWLWRAGVDAEPDAFRQARQRYAFGRIIYGSHPWELLQTPLLRDTVLPRVAIISDPWTGAPDIPAVYPDIQSFFRRALRRLAECGRHRPALVTHSHYRVDLFEQLLAEMHEAAFEHEPWWFQQVPVDAPEMAVNAVLALFNPYQQRRPDALIVVDDLLVGHAIAATVQAELQVAEDIDVVAYCNFPAKQAEASHVHYLGFDARDVLAACRKQLALLAANQPAEPMTSIAAKFESELTVIDHGRARTPIHLSQRR